MLAILYLFTLDTYYRGILTLIVFRILTYIRQFILFIGNRNFKNWNNSFSAKKAEELNLIFY